MHPDVAPLLLVRECMPDQFASLGTAACVVDKAGNGMALSSWSASDATGAVTVGVVAKGTHQNSMAQGEFSCTTRENEVYIRYDSGVTNPVSPRGPDKIRGPGSISDGAWDTEAATIRQLNPLTDEVYSGISGRITA